MQCKFWESYLETVIGKCDRKSWIEIHFRYGRAVCTKICRLIPAFFLKKRISSASKVMATRFAYLSELAYYKLKCTSAKFCLANENLNHESTLQCWVAVVTRWLSLHLDPDLSHHWWQWQWKPITSFAALVRCGLEIGWRRLLPPPELRQALSHVSHDDHHIMTMM